MIARHGHARSCRDECTTDPAAGREPVVFDLARYGQGQSRMSVPSCDSMTHGNDLPLDFAQLGRRV